VGFTSIKMKVKQEFLSCFLITHRLIHGCQLGWLLTAKIHGKVDIGADDIVMNASLG
jgi:hypothetical protein